MRMRDKLFTGVWYKVPLGHVSSCTALLGIKRPHFVFVVVRYIYTMISGTRAVRRLVPISRRGLLVNG